MMKLGLDLWRVILCGSQPSLTEPRVYVDDVFNCVSEISNTIGHENMFIVSIIKSGHLDIHIKTFIADDLYRRLKIPATNVRFINRRWNDPEITHTKAAEVTELGITHFVDDQIRILARLPEGVKGYWLNDYSDDGDETLFRVEHHYWSKEHPRYRDWQTLKEVILKDFEKERRE